MIRAMLTVLVTWVLLLTVTACDRSGESAQGERSGGADAAAGAGRAGGLTRVRLALNWKPEPQFGGFYHAREDGTFAANGLEVTLLEGGSGTPTAQMIDAGRAEFGIVSADELVVLRSRGGDIVALFAVYQTNPQGLMTHAARGITSLKQLLETPGTVAWQAGLPYVQHFRKLYDLSRLQQVPYTGGFPFLNGPDFSQQCFVTSEPILARQQGHAVTTFLIADSGYNPYTTVLVTRRDYLQRNPEVVRQMVRSVRSGWERYLADPTAANAAMQRLNASMDARTFAESAEAQKPLIETEETRTHGLGHMTEARWQQLIDQLVEYGVVRSAVPAADCFVPPETLAGR